MGPAAHRHTEHAAASRQVKCACRRGPSPFWPACGWAHTRTGRGVERRLGGWMDWRRSLRAPSGRRPAACINRERGCGSFLESSADGRRDDGRLSSRRADALMRIRPARCAAPSLSGCLKISRRAGRLCGFFCGQLHFKMPHSRRTRFRWIVCGLHMRTILQVRSSAVSSLPSSQPRTRPIKLKDEVAERCRSNNS